MSHQYHRDYINYLEHEIVYLYHRGSHPHMQTTEQLRTLLHLRKEMLDLWAHNNQHLLYDEIFAFNEALTKALSQLYQQAYDAYAQITPLAPNAELTARCFLRTDNPTAFNHLGLYSEEVWYALTDSEYHPLYQHGASFYELCLPRDIDDSFEHFIGLDEDTDWIPDFLLKLREAGLSVNNAFYNLATASYFAITDFICVRDFENFIDIHIEKSMETCKI